ncbi:GNAT family N-acetyltransferase [Amaricoccus sp.]|uniref:GNAT family N-acetyltransferase n=1 Tax=Amaricoccus sp. TaxID=1872485 RepID=UPI001B44AB35|nr:GNAT family N-acetyltransferase [Amaricoccus sp.]MBP7241803.1 GNAT family N-acetyltransferase [Amaricoccus sp.]
MHDAAIAPIRPLTAAEAAASPALLALNNAHATELSALDAARFGALAGRAFMAARIGEADALLLAFDETADYDSPNYLWFRARHDRFVYVDRVVVAPAARGRGLARALYAALVARTRTAGAPRIVCEVNALPPNPASDAFHAALGFAPAGEGRLAGGKRVRYLALPLDAADPTAARIAGGRP